MDNPQPQSSHVTHQKITAVKRLLRDLLEVLAEPLPNIAALPLEDNLFVWHGNVQGSEGPFCGVPIHFTLEFPQNYPEAAPLCRLATGVPHPNVRSIGAGYRLSLWDCIPQQDAWSCAYTVQSILIQLQQFLLADELQYNDRLITVDNAVKQAMELKIPAVNHKGTNPWPAFPTEEELKNSRQTKKILCVNLPKPSKHKKQLNVATKTKISSSGNKASKEQVNIEESKSSEESSSQGDTSQPSEPIDSEWKVVTSKKANKAKKIPIHATNLPQTNQTQMLETTNTFAELKNIKEPKIVIQKPKIIQRIMETSNISKASKRNKRRAQKRQHKNNLEQQSSSSSSATPTPTPTPQTIPPKIIPPSSASTPTPSSTPTPTPTPSFTPTPTPNDEGDWMQVKTENKNIKQAQIPGEQILQQPHKELIQKVIQEFQNNKNLQSSENFLIADDQYPNINRDEQSSMGYFGTLPVQTIFQIMCQLNLKDIQGLSISCKGLNKISQSGEIWQNLLQSQFPGSRLTATHISHCKHMFMLELNNIVGEMTCFFSKKQFDEKKVVLGLPYRFTVNPKTQKIDYIDVDSELMSLEIFHNCGIRKNLRGEKIQGVLPLYLTEDHFQKAIKYFPQILRQLAPDLCEGGRTPTPNAWIQIIPKIMNTNAVLLCDKGIKATEKSLIIYSQLQRLLMAICMHYNLWGQIDQILYKAIKNEGGRHKNEFPNMGNIFPLIGVSKKFSWKNCAHQFVSESFDRAIIWICKNDENLIEKFKLSENFEVDLEFNKAAFNACIVARRLMMFQVAFLQFVAKPKNFSLEEIIDRLDSLYGHPSRIQIKQFNKAVQSILKVENFSQFFKYIGLQDCGEKQLTTWLRQSWKNSLKKGYHQQNMDFSRIQKSGVSKILLKGETYTAPPNMKEIQMVEHWRYEGTYLDASCLLYDNQGKFVEVIDYSHMSSIKVAGVHHSGDVITENSGNHTINLNLKQLPKNITNIYITMSSWAGVKLSQIKQPFVSLVDPETEVSLCEYYLEDLDEKIGSQNSCVIMCRIFLGKNNSWSVQALGVVCQGCAGSYSPIKKTIQENDFPNKKQ